MYKLGYIYQGAFWQESSNHQAESSAIYCNNQWDNPFKPSTLTPIDKFETNEQTNKKKRPHGNIFI